jgi:hypothetical protein
MQMLTRIVPVVIDGQEIYPSNHAVIAQDPLIHYQWNKLELPANLANKGYYFEIWDSGNKPVPGFRAQKLESNIVDIKSIDPSLMPGIRVVLFKPSIVTETINVNQSIYFTYQQATNYNLFGLAILLTLIYVGLIIAAVKWRITFKNIWHGTKRLLTTNSKSYTDNENIGRTIALYGWLTLLWSGLFGVILGSYIGGIQIIYLIIKLPFLLIGALIFSLISLVVLSLLLGVKASVKEIIVQAFQLIAITALALASFSPIMWFYIHIPQVHDQLLVSMVMFFCISGMLAAFCLAKWLKNLHWLTRWVITGIWVLLYGMVLLQLGWLLRPWVGITDDLHGTLPFTRLYSGNVYVELFNTIQRTAD